MNAHDMHALPCQPQLELSRHCFCPYSSGLVTFANGQTPCQWDWILNTTPLGIGVEKASGKGCTYISQVNKKLCAMIQVTTRLTTARQK